jgi:hypothetical protein
MLRVAHVISDTNIGGAGRYLLGLLGGAETYGWKPFVCLPEGPLADAIRQSSSAEVIILPEGERSLSRGAATLAATHSRFCGYRSYPCQPGGTPHRQAEGL